MADDSDLRWLAGVWSDLTPATRDQIIDLARRELFGGGDDREGA